MCKIYYSKTAENDFEDNNLDKIPKKRNNENNAKKFIMFLEKTLNKKEKPPQKINKRIKKK